MSKREKFYFAIGLMGAIVGGGLVPAVAFVMGDVTDSFNPQHGFEELLDKMKDSAIFITILAGCIWIFSYFYYAFWQHLAENITSALRERYMSSLLKQEI